MPVAPSPIATPGQELVERISSWHAPCLSRSSLPATSIEHARRSRSVPASSVSPATAVSIEAVEAEAVEAEAVEAEAVEAAAVQSLKPVVVEIEGIEVET